MSRKISREILYLIVDNLDLSSHSAGATPFLRLKLNVLSDNLMSSETTNISCAFGAIDMKYDRLLESRFLEMFEGTPTTRTKSARKFGTNSGPAQEVNWSFSCPCLKSEIRFQALEVANVQKKLRPDVLVVSKV